MRPDAAAGQLIRNRANWLSAWVVQLMILGLVVVTDPLRLTTAHDLTLPPGDRVMSSIWVVFLLLLTLVSLSAVAFFAVPRVLVAEESLRVVNPLMVVEVPRSSVRRVDVSQRHPVLVVGTGEEIALWGAERSLLMRIRGERRLSELLAALPKAGDGGAVTRAWRRPTKVEWVVLTLWLCLLVTALVRWLLV